MKISSFFAFLFFVSICFSGNSQFAFNYVDSISVIHGGNALKMPWAGGLNYIQISDIDYDYDGDYGGARRRLRCRRSRYPPPSSPSSSSSSPSSSSTRTDDRVDGRTLTHGRDMNLNSHLTHHHPPMRGFDWTTVPMYVVSRLQKRVCV